jgi:hypothetical protein
MLSLGAERAGGPRPKICNVIREIDRPRVPAGVLAGSAGGRDPLYLQRFLASARPARTLL